MPAHPNTDVIFAGGGISALIAAVDLAHGGRRVSIYDGLDRLGGQCWDAFGGIFLVDTPEQRRVGIKDSFELAWQDWQGYAEFGPEEQLPRYWAQRYIERCVPDVREWMVGQGLSFFPAANWAERAHAGKGNRVPRFHLTWGCGSAIAQTMTDQVQQLRDDGRISIHLGHYVEDLILDSGAVTGIRGTASGQEFTALADHVVISGGGFAGNLDKVRGHWPEPVWGLPPADLLNGVWPWVDGHLHDRAEAAGARMSELDNLWVYAAGVTHWKGDYPGHGLAMIPPKSALWLDGEGRRFDPPLLAGTDTRELVARICNQPRQWSWMIANRKILERELAIQGSAFNPGFREREPLRIARDLALGNKQLTAEFIDRCPDAVSAPDLLSLTQRMNSITPEHPVDAEALIRDVRSYDAEIARGRKFFTDPQLVELRSVRAFLSDRLRTANYRPILDPHGGELVAIRLRPAVRKSMGGIVTDKQCRVLTGSGEALPGLYAIGEAAGFGGGGMNGKRTLEGTLLGGCIFTARELARQL